ncbi:MAG TPA: sulfatase-like hydrolase/transferase [Oscillospiraceae bacterium]|nr:sulfatase-like hydrolase/transferase [Oscillospiraceae bacterium]
MKLKDQFNNVKQKYENMDAGRHFLLLGIFTVFYFVWQETLMYFLTRTGAFNPNYFAVLFFAILNGIVLWGIVVIIPPRARRIVVNIFLLAATVFIGAQLIYFSFFRTYFILSSIGRGGQIVEFMDIILQLIWNRLLAIILLFLPVILFAFFLSKKKTDFKRIMGWKRFLPLIAALVIGIAVHLIFFFLPKTTVAREYFFYLNRPYQASEYFGTYTAMGIDLRNSIFEFKGTRDKLQDDYVDPTLPTMPTVTTLPGGDNPGETSANTNSTDPAQTEGPTETEPPVIDNSPNVLNIDFEALAAGRDSQILAQMDQYFASVEATEKNEYTGMFEGYNLIVITAESFSRFVPDPELTPTLYKMMTEGFYLKNFYNPIWSVSTFDGEYVVLTSLYPKDGVWSLYHMASREQAFSYPTRLPDYASYAFHNHTFDYYSRDVSHPAMGYDYYALGRGLDVTPSWPESDLEMMELSVDKWIDQEPFNVYYLTVSGHAAYTRIGNAMVTKNWHRVEDLPMSEEAKGYIACNLELEDAMTYLLERLRDAGIADRTLIVLSADHYPYGLSDASLNEFAGEILDHQFELYRSTGIIYADGMEPVEVNKYVANIDLMPTIYNLMGVPYDSRLLMGRDMLSDSPGLVLFNDLSWISEYGRYTSSTGTFEVHAPYDPESIPEGYITTINDIVHNRFYFSRLILDEDYYAKIGPLTVTTGP